MFDRYSGSFFQTGS